VVTEATGPALKEMLGELTKMADAGLTQEEFAKVRAQDRADLVSTYETTGGTARRLSSLALLGLPPTFDATATEARQKATLARLAELSGAVGPKSATVVIVGPRDQVLPQIKDIGLGEPVLWDVEARPLGAKAAP
jgi:predicted Zn-dependent peptidase